MTALDWLRDEMLLTGTKEGCAEGDCGACTIVVGEAANGQLKLRAVNACITLLGQLDGASVTTVEGLADGAALHPVQQSLIETDSTQCGFCTPGIAMSMYAFHHGGEVGEDDAIHELLAGNLCRCTGYRPIVEACRRIAGGAPLAAGVLPAMQDRLEANGRVLFAPRSLAELVALRTAHSDAVLLAGGTDLGLRASKGRDPLPVVISVGRVAELRRVETTNDAVEVGAAVTYEEMLPVLAEYFPAFAAMLRRLGSRQIRNMGTLGGNIGTASPIGDTLPVLLALDAGILLHGPDGRRVVAANDYFTDYRKTVLRPDEIIEAVRLPRLSASRQLAVYKLSKRFDQDISTVIAAFRTGDGPPRAAYGGMAAVPKRAIELERAIAEDRWDQIDAAVAADFSPLTDQRGSSAYRLQAAANLARRLRFERKGISVRLEHL